MKNLLQGEKYIYYFCCIVFILCEHAVQTTAVDLYNGQFREWLADYTIECFLKRKG